MFLERAARFAFGATGGGGGSPVPVDNVQQKTARRPKLGLALGGGAARGWAHVGVVRELTENGIVPDVVAGTSIGAVVGGCHAADNLDAIEEFARSLTRRRVVGLLDIHIGGSGLIGGERLRKLLERDMADTLIEKLPCRFTAIATEIRTGHEIWLTRGRLVDAMRASYALPGIFDPVKVGGRWLMDGALVNPVPVTAARAAGAEVVVSVNLAGDAFGRGTIIPAHGTADEEDIVETVAQEVTTRGLLAPMRDAANRMNPFAGRNARPDAPRLATVMIEAFNITQDRIARARLAGDPPDVMISPLLQRVGLFEFHKAEEAVEAGRAAAKKAIPAIRDVMEAMAVAA